MTAIYIAPETTIKENDFARLYSTKTFGFYVEDKGFKFSNGRNRHYPYARNEKKALARFDRITTRGRNAEKNNGSSNLSPVHSLLINS